MKKIKNGYVNKLICIVWVLSSFAFTAYADEYDIIPEEVEIIVTSPDSVVRMHIAGKIKKIKPSSEVTYYWYASKRIHQNAGGYSGRLLHGDYNVYNADGKQ